MAKNRRLHMRPSSAKRNQEAPGPTRERGPLPHRKPVHLYIGFLILNCTGCLWWSGGFHRLVVGCACIATGLPFRVRFPVLGAFPGQFPSCLCAVSIFLQRRLTIWLPDSLQRCLQSHYSRDHLQSAPADRMGPLQSRPPSKLPPTKRPSYIKSKILAPNSVGVHFRRVWYCLCARLVGLAVL